MSTTISINTGDTVIWINDGGYHDVNGVSNSITGQPFNNPQTFSSQTTSVQGGVIHTKYSILLVFIVMIVQSVRMLKTEWVQFLLTHHLARLLTYFWS